MNALLLSKNKMASNLLFSKVFRGIYRAESLFIFGLVIFSFLVWQTITSSVMHIEGITASAIQNQAVFPDKKVVQELKKLYEVTTNHSQKREKDRFLVREHLADDTVLRAAPKANSHDNIVGILTSSTPEKNIAIIESAGKQQSYSVQDRVAGTLTILKIFNDRVIVNENGSYAAFILEE